MNELIRKLLFLIDLIEHLNNLEVSPFWTITVNNKACIQIAKFRKPKNGTHISCSTDYYQIQKTSVADKFMQKCKNISDLY